MTRQTLDHPSNNTSNMAGNGTIDRKSGAVTPLMASLFLASSKYLRFRGRGMFPFRPASEKGWIIIPTQLNRVLTRIFLLSFFQRNYFFLFVYLIIDFLKH